MNVTKAELQERLVLALTEVTAAEAALETALHELRGGLRAEKVTVTAVVEEAFGRLRRAQAELRKLRDLLDQV